MPTYRPNISERRRENEELQIFVGEVLTVDYERKVCTVRDLRTGAVYQGIAHLPALHSSFEGTDVIMPETGSRCYAAHLASNAGFFDVAIIGWIASDTNRAQQGIAIRAIDTPDLQGWNQRVRGSYRKAYPGQNTTTLSEGYTERKAGGWDRSASDASRDWMDPISRTWTRITSREVSYSDGATRFEGPIQRPGAAHLSSETLPDGNTRQIAYLAPGVTAKDRYVNGKPDVIALVERTEKIPEFAIDFPIPAEVIGTAVLDSVLGTTADPWGRTTTNITDGIIHDDQSQCLGLGKQPVDHPYDTTKKFVGPTTNDGPTPRRRGYILERSEGTHVGSNVFDSMTYGRVLKPVIYDYTRAGRFAVNVESWDMPVNNSTDQVETRVAASAYSVRFPHEGNTTRWDVTKEGMLSCEIGATLPKENIPLDKKTYEHPHGAGRSVEAHLVGSMKLVVGKNRDEEEALDLTALGQVVLRLGADDTSLPVSTRRPVLTQLRGHNDLPLNRTLQYWDKEHRALQSLGDAVNLEQKKNGENVSLRGAFDGGTILRLGARNKKALRKHLINGYQDPQGIHEYGVDDASRVDSKTSGRKTYGSGDSLYAFKGHDLTQVGKALGNPANKTKPQLPYSWSGSPVKDMDKSGLSLDVHAVRDVLLRVGSNEDSGQSMLLDLAGGIVAAVGSDLQGRSLTAALDGGVELTIGASKAQKGIRLEIRGDVDWTIYGNWHVNVTGDIVMESTNWSQTAKVHSISRAMAHHEFSQTRSSTEAPDFVQSQGANISNLDSSI